MDGWIYCQDLISNFPYCLQYSSHFFEFEEFGIGLANNPPIDIFLYSHHFSASYFIDIVRRNSVLVTNGS